MQITREGTRARWLIMGAVWAAVFGIVLWNTVVMRNYVALLDQVGRPGMVYNTPFVRPLPGNFADAQAWVRLAIGGEEQGEWRVRHSDIDNAPAGRENHWSSLFLQLIASAGRIQHALTGEPLPRAMENALAWFTLPLLLGCVIFFSAWAAQRLGAGGGLLVAVGFIGHATIYDGFTPNYGDHHGLLTAAAFGLVFGAMLMGAGWRRTGSTAPGLLPDSLALARRDATISALSGAIGMWVSAASTIPVVAITGLSGLATVVLFGRRARQEGAVFEPSVWRRWGRVGGGASAVCYLLEYAPSHLGFRLEVNHPFHALAWWGAAELVALIGTWYLEPKKGRPAARQWALPALAVVATPITIVVGGAAVFMVRDPFVAELRHTVLEGMSFRAAVRFLGQAYAQRYLINFFAVAVGIGLVLVSRRERMTLGFATLMALGFVGLSCWEIRWWLTAGASIMVLLITGVMALGAKWREPARWALTLVVAAIVLPSGAIATARAQQQSLDANVAEQQDLLQPLYRDIAAVLRSTQPNGEIVLLASPDASNSIGYYGRFKTIGTLYWENTAGLKAAAAIYNAERDEDALERIRARGITHVVFVSKGDYVEEYFKLAEPDRPPGDVAKGFAHRVFVQQQFPRWLRIIPYRPPPNMAIPNLRVLLFQFAPEQSVLEARWHVARALLEGGDAAGAEQFFRQSIALANPNQRAPLFHRAGDVAYQQRSDALAIKLYREAVTAGGDTKPPVELAWLLATNQNASLRNGRDALALLEPVVRANPNDAVALNAWAGVLAENGHFPEAVDAAQRAITLLQGAGDARDAAVVQQRLERYRAKQPWRE